MKCPHCGVEARFMWLEGNVNIHPAPAGRAVRYGWCPSETCGKLVFYFGISRNELGMYLDMSDIHWRMIEPSGADRGPIPPEIPSNIAGDYIEACNVLAISPKASAALSRRCLQSMLRAHGYKDKDLAKEIDLLLGEADPAKAIPITLRTVVDAVRNFGNFSAHPITDVTTLQIIDVEPEEAEWCLEIIEECFQHFYVRPAQAAERKAALNAKLAAAGKPLAK